MIKYTSRKNLQLKEELFQLQLLEFSVTVMSKSRDVIISEARISILIPPIHSLLLKILNSSNLPIPVWKTILLHEQSETFTPSPSLCAYGYRVGCLFRCTISIRNFTFLGHLLI